MRYVQSDPIGLRGGLSTFAYASSAPLHRQDRWGLFTFVNCSSDQQDAVNAAMPHVSSAWKECFGEKCKEPLPPTPIVQQGTSNPNFPSFASALLNFTCMPAAETGCGGMNVSIEEMGSNGLMPVGSSMIWYDGNPLCSGPTKCLQRTIFHEFLHFADSRFNNRSRNSNHDEIDPIAERCINCPPPGK